MKKIATLTIAVIILISLFCFNVSAQENVTVYIDGAKIEFDVQPQVINGRTMVPIRAIFEKMGAVVEWDGNTNSAICTKGDTVVKMTINSTDMYINNQLTKIDISPVVIDGRILAPARYVAEAFDADVQWSQKNNSVVICSKDVYAYADYPDIPDLGRCFNISTLRDVVEDEYRVFAYSCSDINNDYSSYLYKNSASVLGNYQVEIDDSKKDEITNIYTKNGETIPRYYIVFSNYEKKSILMLVKIPLEKIDETKENKVQLYALDGRTIEVLESEVEAYLNFGWYRTIEETQQTMYAPDGRSLTVFKSQVSAYKNVGWYETQFDAQAANNTTNNTNETLLITNPPMLNNLNNKLSTIINEVLSSNKYSGNDFGLKNYTVVIPLSDGTERRILDEEFVGFGNYTVAADYGENELYLVNLKIDGGVVSSISNITNEYIPGNLLADRERLSLYAQMTLAPMLLTFNSGNYLKLSEILWGQMDVEATRKVQDSKYTELIETTYKYENNGVKIFLYVTNVYGLDGNTTNYSVITAEAEIPSSLINLTKTQNEYITAKKNYEDSISQGTYKNWERATITERYFATIDLLEEILKKDGVYKSVMVDSVGGISSNRNISGHLIPLCIMIKDISLDTPNGRNSIFVDKATDGNISVFVSGARNDLVYRIYRGDINNKDYDDWIFDWDGNLIESSTNLSISEYIQLHVQK